MARQEFSIQEIFSGSQIKHMLVLYEQLRNTGRFASECAKQYVEPHLPHIEKVLGQKMDARYVAYVVEYTFMMNESSKE